MYDPLIGIHYIENTNCRWLNHPCIRISYIKNGWGWVIIHGYLPWVNHHPLTGYDFGWQLGCPCPACERMKLEKLSTQLGSGPSLAHPGPAFLCTLCSLVQAIGLSQYILVKEKKLWNIPAFVYIYIYVCVCVCMSVCNI